MNGEQFEKFEKVAQMLRRNRGVDIKLRQEKEKVANALEFEKEDTIKKEQEQLKEVWTEKQKVGNSLGFKEIKKINNKASTSKGQISSSKSQKM